LLISDWEILGCVCHICQISESYIHQSKICIWRKMMKSWYIGFVLVLVVGVLVGCGGSEQTASDSADEGGSETFTSAALDTSYDSALNASSQLVLGTLKLEGTANAVTPEQAKTLLPLWQALQGGVTAQAEIDALLKQIEGTMTQEQLAAIAAMQLTQEDLQVWMQEQGPGMGGGFPGAGGDLSEEEQESLRATMEAGGGMPEGGGPFGDLSEEERANLRATMEAGGGMPEGGGQFGDLSEEERANLRATMEAGGGGMPGGRPGGGAGGRQFGPLLNPLLELLTERAAE
jgi:hypothetical protein